MTRPVRRTGQRRSAGYAGPYAYCEANQSSPVRASLMTERLPHLPDVVVPPGVFWADHIKSLKSHPEARLALALQNRPLPAAFGEAAIALRALIREKRRQNAPAHDLLKLLYRIHSQAVFLLSTPYIEGIGSGFNVAQSMPPSSWGDLEYPYDQLGCQHLGITRTDTPWFVQAWGEPHEHQAPRQLYGDIWNRAVSQCRQEMKREGERVK